jgi:hypothetical protein
MTTNVHKTALLGELVVAAFDGAARYSTDPKEVSRLAAAAVMHVLWRTSGRVPLSRWTEGKTFVADPRVGTATEVIRS